MASNSFGDFFKYTSWGESHGKAIGCVVDGVPPLIDLKEDDIQQYLDLRKPGQSKFTTQRKEDDKIEILSGIFEGKTTGTPISLIIYNQDQKSKDYGDIKDKLRPGHADYTYQMKYGIRDYRGGGRSSARETAMRVAAGAIARKIMPSNIKIMASMIEMGDIKICKEKWDYNTIINNPFFIADKSKIKECEDYLTQIRKAGNSVGAKIEIRISNVPVGLGDPIYDKLDSKLAAAIMSINAVKSVEIGAGDNVAKITGSKNADEISVNNQVVEFDTNNAGGILGGISSGQEIIIRFAIKPTSSILIPKKTINTKKENTEILTKGRHDPCVGIRAVPVAEAMAACVIADSYLKNIALTGKK
ncbi:MAG: chorismate synthase [Rickettsiales bacterium]|nr:chorismate synthase [Rickettsiales bacterium]